MVCTGITVPYSIVNGMPVSKQQAVESCGIAEIKSLTFKSDLQVCVQQYSPAALPLT